MLCTKDQQGHQDTFSHCNRKHRNPETINQVSYIVNSPTNTEKKKEQIRS